MVKDFEGRLSAYANGEWEGFKEKEIDVLWGIYREEINRVVQLGQWVADISANNATLILGFAERFMRQRNADKYPLKILVNDIAYAADGKDSVLGNSVKTQIDQVKNTQTEWVQLSADAAELPNSPEMNHIQGQIGLIFDLYGAIYHTQDNKKTNLDKLFASIQKLLADEGVVVIDGQRGKGSMSQFVVSRGIPRISSMEAIQFHAEMISNVIRDTSFTGDKLLRARGFKAEQADLTNEMGKFIRLRKI